MSTPQSSTSAILAVVAKSLLWLWLIGLSMAVLLGFQAMNRLADRERVDSGLQRLQVQVAALTEATEALRQRPVAATAADLQETRQTLDARIAQLEQARDEYARTEDLQALHAELEQIKAHQMTVQVAPPVPPRPVKPAAAKPTPSPLPFRVVDAELRAGERSVSIAPAKRNFSVDEIQVLLPGDAVGPWRLLAIDGDTAVFQAGRQTRRVAIP